MNNRKGALILLLDGIKQFNYLVEKKSFWIADVLCLGFFDVISALFSTTYPNLISSQLMLDISIGGNLLIFLGVFILLILTGKEKVFGPRSIGNLWRVWSTEFVAGLWVSLGFLCFIIPGLFLAIRYIYAAEVALLENSRISRTLMKSRKLSSVNGGKVFLACTVVLVLYFLLVFALVFIIGLINTSTLNSFAMNYFLSVTSTLMATLWCTIVYAGYLDALSYESSSELKAAES